MNVRKLIIITMAAAASIALADIKPAGLFTDNMVIQRETKAPVWGWGDAGEKVTVSGSWGKSARTTVDDTGKWTVKLQTPAAGGPYTLTLKGDNTVELKNILSGDVWLCSGQSNMQWPVSKALNPAEEAAAADYPQIRSFMVGRVPMTKEAADCQGAWTVCSPETVSDFSATAYFTGRELHKNLDVPIGLLTSCWGGTCVEAWTPLADQSEDAFALQRKAALDTRAETYTPEQAKVRFEQQMKSWEQKSAEAKARKKRAPRRPKLQTDPLLNHNYPGNLYNGMVHPLLTFAVKGAIWYQGEANAQDLASAEHYRVQLDRMVRSWRIGWGQDIPFYAVQLPNFRKSQVHPVESEDTWPAIRESFVHVAQNTPEAYTCTTIDLGEAGNIHPKNKQGVGSRMASTILNNTYDKGTPTTPFMKSFAVEGSKVVVCFDYTGSGLMARGGELKGFAVAGADKRFVWADALIEQRDGEDCVVVSSEQVNEPVAVRYAWANNPACGLYSKEDFPASPFRTDTWDLKEAKPAPAKAAPLGGQLLKKNDVIVFLGDSITAVGARPGGYVALSSDAISKAYPEYGIEVVGAGIGGHKVPNCQKRLDRDVLQKKPTIVVIYIGINDVWHWTLPKVVARGGKGSTPEEFESGLRDMIKRINGVGARVILCTPTVIGEKADGSNPQDKVLDEYSDISRKVAEETGSELLDLRKLFISYLKTHNPMHREKGILTVDSVHMNDEGNRLLSELMLKALGVAPKPDTTSIKMAE
jgi:sialate O-acetylesterase